MVCCLGFEPIMSLVNIFKCIGEVAAPEKGECGQCSDLVLYTLACALQLRKIMKNCSRGIHKVLG